MAKLLAFWSGLSLSGAARIEVHEFKSQVTQPPPTVRCHVGDHVVCPDYHEQQCSGNQCCADGSTCPSADDDFTGCPRGKTWLGFDTDCTHHQTLGCEACSGVESDCCVETQGYPPETVAIRCINPAIDVCHEGFVCPLSKPSVCQQYTCMLHQYDSMYPSGDATCFNPETHACIQPHGTSVVCVQPLHANQVCPIGSVVCGGACLEEDSGVCCGATWYRTEERKQCCQGRCQGGGCQTWACNADMECKQPLETGYSDDDLSRNCRWPNRGVDSRRRR